VGYGNQEAPINLGWCNNMIHLGSVVHEIGHVLGLNHPMKRPDATHSYYGHGPYLRIHWQNIPSKAATQYLPDPASYTGSAGDGPGDPHKGYAEYDLSSIMHYPRMRMPVGYNYDTIPFSAEAQAGQREKLTAKDIRAVNDMYQCKYQPKYRRLNVWLLMGLGLANKDRGLRGKSDPWVKMWYTDNRARRSEWTHFVDNTLDPRWNTKFSLDNWNIGTELQFDVFDDDGWSGSEHMGKAIVSPQVIYQHIGSYFNLPVDQGGQLVVRCAFD